LFENKLIATKYWRSFRKRYFIRNFARERDEAKYFLAMHITAEAGRIGNLRRCIVPKPRFLLREHNSRTMAGRSFSSRMNSIVPGGRFWHWHIESR